MKRVLLSVLAVIAVVFSVVSQNTAISISRLTMDPLDQAARNYPKTDVNGDLYALIKVRPACDNLKSTFGYMKCIPDNVPHENETWLYVQKNARRISISGEGYDPVMNADLGQTLEAGLTYVMELKFAKEKAEEVVAASAYQYIIFRVAIPDAVIRINGKSLKPKDGVVSAKLPLGRHDYEVSAPMYETTIGVLTADDSQTKLEVPVKMLPLFKEVKLTVADGAEIWIDGERKATGSWTGNLEFSNYSIECRKTGYKTSQQDIVISREGPSAYTLTAPTPMYGSIEVEVEPVDAEVYLDGKKMGTTPMLLSKVLAGSHEIKVVKSKFEELTKSVTVEENATLSVTGELKEKPTGIYEVNGVQFTMIPVDGGTFQMGATEEQGSEAYSDEKPVHSVTLSSYMIGETEVTQALWQAVMGRNPSNWKGDNLPVEQVSWKDCQKFIEKLNKLTGEHFRLPTEAEWEFAARGGNRSSHTKYSGSNSIGDVAWYTDNSGNKTCEVKGKQPNELGLYDMSGNVWEWCQDRYGDYSSSAQTNPVGPASGSNRVYRGGSWDDDARYCRVSDRSSLSPFYRSFTLGLRLAL